MNFHVNWEYDNSGAEELIRRMKEFEGPEIVSLTDLLTPEFMADHTEYDDPQPWLDASGLDWESGDFMDPPAELDDYVARTTDFDTWSDMIAQANADRIRRRLEE